MLETRGGLQQIGCCMAGNIPLHGISEDNPGISECRCLYLEFQKQKHAPAHGSEKTGGSTSDPSKGDATGESSSGAQQEEWGICPK